MPIACVVRTSSIDLSPPEWGALLERDEEYYSSLQQAGHVRMVYDLPETTSRLMVFEVASFEEVLDLVGESPLAEVGASGQCDRLPFDDPGRIESPTEHSNDSGDDSPSFSFSDSLLIDAPMAEIYACLWEVRRWPELISHVRSIRILDEEDSHHVFEMETVGPGGAHIVKSARRIAAGGVIEYEQLVRPPLLKSHTGHWDLKQTDEGVLATSNHSIELDTEHIEPALGRDYSVKEARTLVRHFVGNHSLSTLVAIRDRPSDAGMEHRGGE